MNRPNFVALFHLARVLAVTGLALVFGCEPVYEADWEESFDSTQQGLSKCEGGSVGDLDYCSPSCPCVGGEGDCDQASECIGGTICGVNNGAKFGFPYVYDFCSAPHCFNGVLDGDETAVDCGSTTCGACICETGTNGDGSFCTASCPCSEGEGDCDSDAQCEAGLTCVNNVGADFGQPASNDICLSASCFDGMMNGMETGVDCGGSCTACAPSVAALASVDSDGNQGNDRSFLFYDTSANGRYVVFSSESSNLVAGDTNGVADVFRRDQVNGTTEIVSRNGAPGNGASVFASISSDGRYVAFVSSASNMSLGDNNGVSDVFVRDMNTNSIRRLSSGNGSDMNAGVLFAQISGNGRYVAYSSDATNIVAGDTNGVRDVFLADRITLNNIRVSVGPGGVQGDGASDRPTVSDNGRYIAFESRATNFTTTDTNGVPDVFLRDRSGFSTTLVSKNLMGDDSGNSSSIFAVVSGSGQHVAFRSNAGNLVTDDTNGRYDIFVRTVSMGTTERVSESSGGVQADAASVESWISSNGNLVVFSTTATNLGGDTNGGTTDIYVRNRSAGTTELVFSGNGASGQPVISSDGTIVVYRTAATDAVASDTNGQLDIIWQPL